MKLCTAVMKKERVASERRSGEVMERPKLCFQPSCGLCVCVCAASDADSPAYALTLTENAPGTEMVATSPMRSKPSWLDQVGF